jgi:hypothetical protein
LKFTRQEGYKFQETDDDCEKAKCLAMTAGEGAKEYTDEADVV